MMDAIKAIVDGRMGYKKASKVYNVPQTTLERRVKIFKNNSDPQLAVKKGKV